VLGRKLIDPRALVFPFLVCGTEFRRTWSEESFLIFPLSF
jgi:hypothetical protein